MTARDTVLAIALGIALVAWVACYWALVIVAHRLIAFVKRTPSRATSKPLNLRAVWTNDETKETS